MSATDLLARLMVLSYSPDVRKCQMAMLMPALPHLYGSCGPLDFLPLIPNQEMVRFCRTMRAPAAGVFCQGELGPPPTIERGILPTSCRSRLQAFSSCTAVLYWDSKQNRAPGDTFSCTCCHRVAQDDKAIIPPVRRMFSCAIRVLDPA